MKDELGERMKDMNEIIYLETAKAHWKYKPAVLDKPGRRDGIFIETYPTKCKVTINGSIIINDVYVRHSNTGQIFLFKEYKVEELWDYSSPVFGGRNLVLEFKSENYIIEKYE